MNFERIENGVAGYAAAVKGKLVSINGKTISLGNRLSDAERQAEAGNAKDEEIDASLVDLRGLVEGLDTSTKAAVEALTAKDEEIDASIVDLNALVDTLTSATKVAVDLLKAKDDEIDASIGAIISSTQLALDQAYDKDIELDASIVDVRSIISDLDASLDAYCTTHATDVSRIVKDLERMDASLNGGYASLKLTVTVLDSSAKFSHRQLAEKDAEIDASLVDVRGLISAIDSSTQASAQALLAKDVEIDASIVQIEATHLADYEELVAKDLEIDASVADIKAIIGSEEDEPTDSTLYAKLRQIVQDILDNEEVTAAALTDLDRRVAALESAG